MGSLMNRQRRIRLGSSSPGLAERHPVFAHEMRGRRLDIGDSDGYENAEVWLKQEGSRP